MACECKDCKRRREHFSVVLPFSVAERIVDEPLRISGVAMVAGLSSNLNFYAPDELADFLECAFCYGIKW
ncbi:MAG: hypothetical protein NWF00_03860 [Candidatus Bathyarchaeota archaeon]|nr:hypothetical protein [Candidatus Bathyarchaeota archaeon]